MPHNYWKIWIHLVWTTKNRERILDKEIREKLFGHMKEKSKEQNIWLDIINGVEDHIHCLVSLLPSMSVSEVVNKLKGESSHWKILKNLLKVGSHGKADMVHSL